MGNKIDFSEKALANLSNVGRSHALTSAKNSWSYFLLAAVTLLFSGLMLWGFYGSMVESVSGVGITLLNKGTHPIIANGTGTLTHLNIHIGTNVSHGETLGQIHNAELFFNINKLGNEYTALISEVEILRDGVTKLTSGKIESEKQRQKILTELTALQQKSRHRAEEIVQLYSTLLKSGSASKMSYFESLDAQTQAEISFANTLFQAMEANLSQEETLWQLQRQLLEMQQTLDHKKRELDLAMRLFRESNWISSKFDGKVTEIFKKEGSFVQIGEPIAMVSSDIKEGIYLVTFIPAMNSREIKCGMSANFSPAIAPANRYGYIKGVVREVSQIPINPSAIQIELANDVLTQQIVQQGAVIRVVIELIPDSNTLSGYAWTTKRGYKGTIANGMMGEVFIHIDHRSPASYVLPAVREFFKAERRKQ